MGVKVNGGPPFVIELSKAFGVGPLAPDGIARFHFVITEGPRSHPAEDGPSVRRENAGAAAQREWLFPAYGVLHLVERGGVID